MIEELKAWLDEQTQAEKSPTARVTFAKVRNKIWHLENPAIPPAAPSRASQQQVAEQAIAELE